MHIYVSCLMLLLDLTIIYVVLCQLSNTQHLHATHFNKKHFNIKRTSKEKSSFEYNTLSNIPIVRSFV